MPDRKDQITRITRYEAMLDEATQLLSTNPESERLPVLIKDLEAYYTSDAWKQDYADDEAGLLPADLKRGVLSEDGIYDVLTTYQDFRNTRRNTMEIKERNQIAEQYKWDITTLFANDEAWEKALAEIPEAAEKVTCYQGKLTESPETLRAFLDAEEALDRKIENVYCYASLRSSEDTRAEAGQIMTSKAMGVLTQVMAGLSFAQPEILSMSEEQFKAFMESEALAPYKHTLDDLYREKAHTLSEKEEKLLSGMQEMRHAPGQIANMLMDADMQFDPVVLEDGEELALSASNYILLQTDTRREVREKAFHNFYKSFKNHINTFAATYSNSVKADVFTARTRGYESARAMSMAGENIPAAVYDGLVDTVHKFLPAMYRYVELRKKMLGVPEIHYYDVYAPLVGDLSISYTYEEAKEMVKKAVAPLGEAYVNTVQRGFDERWIDVYPNVGKSGGAYSSGTYDSNPFIMCNFTGTIDSVSTIAHEMGHSMHTHLANTHQPAHYAGYTLFVAEIASTVNENLLIEQLLKEEQDLKTRMYLLNQYLENFKGTVYRQTMFAEFEQKAHEVIEQGGALSVELLNQMYQELVELYFGPSMVLDEEVRYEWARIPHFYRAYYVYKYATGYSSAVALSEKILNEGKPAVEKYLEFLSMAGSDYPLATLQHGGVDLSTSAPIEQALAKFESIVAEAEKTFEALQK